MTPLVSDATLLSARVAAEVVLERGRQDELWGEQNHPDGTGQQFQSLANASRDLCNGAADSGSLSWQLILMEEVCEAFAESDPSRLREELVQVAAVAMGWVEAIDRRG